LLCLVVTPHRAADEGVKSAALPATPF